MQHGHRSVLLGAALLLLSGCNFSSPWGSSSGGSEYGAVNVSGNGGGTTGSGGGGTTTGPTGGVGGEGSTTGKDDTVVTTSNTSLVSVAVGASQTVSVTFNSSDGLAITGFGISGSLSTLPAGGAARDVHVSSGRERQRLRADAYLRTHRGWMPARSRSPTSTSTMRGSPRRPVERSAFLIRPSPPTTWSPPRFRRGRSTPRSVPAPSRSA